MNILTIPLAIIFITFTLASCKDTESIQISPPAASSESTNGNIQLTKEADLSNRDYVEKINNFWNENVQKKQNELNCDGKQINDANSGVFCSTGQIKDANGNIIDIPNARINIHYIKIVKSPAQEKGAIVISTGRTETYLKYKETAYDLWSNGYSVYIIDHRGQGMSDRESGLDDRQKGHVEDFGLFVSDLKYFVDEIVQKGGHQNLYLIAHSMGGAIASLYLEQEGEKAPFQAVAFTSPMHKIQSSIIPGQGTWATCPLASFYSWLCHDCYVGPFLGGLLGVGGGKSYDEKQQNYKKVEQDQSAEDRKKQFDENEYTNSEARYWRMVKEYDENSNVRLGDPTHGWLDRACKAAEYARENSSKITIPVRLYQAGNDSIVHPDGHAKFCKNLTQPGKCGGTNGKPITISGAKHELLIEKDGYRNRVLEEALKFFEEKRKI